MILYGRSRRIRELAMLGFLRPRGGGVVSHLNIHRGVLDELSEKRAEEVSDDFR